MGRIVSVFIKPKGALYVLDGLGQVAEAGFGIAVEHGGAGLEEERVFEAAEAAALSALEYDDALGAIDFEDGHAGDEGFWIVSGIGVDYVVGADDYSHICRWELGIDLFHFVEGRIRDVGLGEQDVHVARHSTGDGMDGVFDGDAAAFKQFA